MVPKVSTREQDSCATGTQGSEEVAYACRIILRNLVVEITRQGQS